jgi:hypothetical protein
MPGGVRPQRELRDAEAAAFTCCRRPTAAGEPVSAQLRDGHLEHIPGGTARARLRGEPARWLLVGAALLGGLLIALLTIHLATPWDARLSGH